MLQSQQTWLPRLHEPVEFSKLLREAHHHQRFIAHCADDDKQNLSGAYDPMLDSHIILIGPEGDFTPAEIITAKSSGFVPVTLGATRLRSETAGIFAAAIGSSF
jgi:16S rRNA (uracil1498-N3)-methyltransferase